MSRLVVLAAAAFGTLAAWPAAANPVECGDRAELTGKLNRIYGQVPLFLGAAGEAVYELWSSPDGIWTIVETRAGRPSCIRARGNDGEWIVQGLGL